MGTTHIYINEENEYDKKIIILIWIPLYIAAGNSTRCLLFHSIHYWLFFEAQLHWLALFYDLVFFSQILPPITFFLFFSVLISLRSIVQEQQHCLLKQKVYNLLCGTRLGLMSFTFINQIMRLYMFGLLGVICKYIYIHNFYLMNRSAFNSNALVDAFCVVLSVILLLFSVFPKFFPVSYLSLSLLSP